MQRRPVVLALVALLGLAACNGEKPAVEAATPTADSPSPAVTAQSPTDSPEAAALPSPVDAIEQGGAYFGVYLAAAPFDTPELQDAVDRLSALGIEAFPGSLACDQGAAAQLRVDPDLAAVAVYFERRRDAVAFASALDPPPIGIALVRTFCAD